MCSTVALICRSYTRAQSAVRCRAIRIAIDDSDGFAKKGACTEKLDSPGLRDRTRNARRFPVLHQFLDGHCPRSLFAKGCPADYMYVWLRLRHQDVLRTANSKVTIVLI